MRIRDSDLPTEEEWTKFFNPKRTLELLGVNYRIKNVADFGCGYGTFTIPAAQMISGKIYALDIEPELVKTVERKAKEFDLNNVVAVLRDFMSEGSGLKDLSIDFVFLFNILHTENPAYLLKEAYRILKRGGKVGIIHWRYDETILGGPSMDIRPKPEQCRHWAELVGFHFEKQFDLKPYHYAIVMKK
jgi:ubiquinone/menaquinone biosynthesis C-methylase UbiE